MGLFVKPRDESDLFEEIQLEKEEFAKVKEYRATEKSHKFHVIVQESNYNLMYRDGEFCGMPQPSGGKIYPFSKKATKQGSRGQKKKYTMTKLVVLTKDFRLFIEWGVGLDRPYKLEDPITHHAYAASASGGFYVTIIPDDKGENANKFYRRCLSQNRNADQTTIRDFLKPAFHKAIEAKIQEYINKKNMSICNFIGLTGDSALQASKELFPDMEYIFDHFGLKIDEVSERSLLMNLRLQRLGQ